jgi:hypothetical protein
LLDSLTGLWCIWTIRCSYHPGPSQVGQHLPVPGVRQVSARVDIGGIRFQDSERAYRFFFALIFVLIFAQRDSELPLFACVRPPKWFASSEYLCSPANRLSRRRPGRLLFCYAVQFVLKSRAFLLELADYRLHQCFWHEAILSLPFRR